METQEPKPTRQFLSTLSLRRATLHSINSMTHMLFLSTLSLRRATRSGAGCLICLLYFYPRSPCGERQNHASNCTSSQCISIHALLAESDSATQWTAIWNLSFLSTLSLRRATIVQLQCILGGKYFYPRSPCGERPGIVGNTDVTRSAFLSTLSLRRATYRVPDTTPWACYFYPRSPCGERLLPCCGTSYSKKFLSTLSLRRATQGPLHRGAIGIFLSTLSLRRATVVTLCTVAVAGYFYPRSPCGERRLVLLERLLI